MASVYHRCRALSRYRENFCEKNLYRIIFDNYIFFYFIICDIIKMYNFD